MKITDVQIDFSVLSNKQKDEVLAVVSCHGFKIKERMHEPINQFNYFKFNDGFGEFWTGSISESKTVVNFDEFMKMFAPNVETASIKNAFRLKKSKARMKAETTTIELSTDIDIFELCFYILKRDFDDDHRNYKLAKNVTLRHFERIYDVKKTNNSDSFTANAILKGVEYVVIFTVSKH